MGRDHVCPSCGNHFLSASNDQPIAGPVGGGVPGSPPMESRGSNGSEACDVLGSGSPPHLATMVDPPALLTISDMDVGPETPASRGEEPPQPAGRPPQSGFSGSDPILQSVIDAPLNDEANLGSLSLGVPSSTLGTGSESLELDQIGRQSEGKPKRRTKKSSRSSDDEVDGRGPTLVQVLLLSYASAMTIACLWLVIKLRRVEPTAPDPAPRPSRIAQPGEPTSLGAWRRRLPCSPTT